MSKHTDPVCGMEVDEEDAGGKSQHQGRTYYFCSESCQNKFEQEPEKYASK
ncbi:MAG: YHS domain-containing protein [Candidatus Latescibacteria bacterium]|nr:YHS domain-containing protein [Candidatus Latescibacterota bacterium]NIO29252.1 YHS domain-containing protein [Candidatus Latescibacterota bacterium]NIO56876.1 YHS domain-containing protein [Candidatus Latescibacterota bacterium]